MPVSAPQFKGFLWTVPPTAMPCIVDSGLRTTHEQTLSHKYCHQRWILDFSLRANGRCRVGRWARPWFHRPAGVAHLYAPGTPYWEDTRDCTHMLHSAWAGFTGGESAGLDAFTTGTGYHRFEDPERELQRHLVDLAERADARGDDAFWESQGTLLSIVSLLLHAERITGDTSRITTKPPEPPAPTLVDTARAFIQANCHRQVLLNDIARACNVSKSSLSHRYKEETGESPIETLFAVRMDRARSLLLRGVPLKVVAAETGFCDDAHLSRTFKARIGLGPREFVKGAAAHSVTRPDS